MSTHAPTAPPRAAAPQPPAGPRRRPRQKFPVFNPGDWPDDVQAGGRVYHFDPQGVTPIEDMLEYDRDEETRRLLTEKGTIIPQGGDAQTIADLIVSSDVRGDKGFIILEGPPETWDAQKRVARAVWVAQHERTVEASIASWEAACAGRVASGLPLAVQPKHVSLAYEWRRTNRVGLTRDYELVCQVCSHDAPTREALSLHIQEIHPRQAAQLQPPATVPIAEALPRAAEEQRTAAPRRIPVRKASAPAPVEPEETLAETVEREAMSAQDLAPAPVEGALGRLAAEVKEPSKDEKVAQGTELAERAQKVGVDLSVADRKGLKHGDIDVIEDVQTRVTSKVSRDEIKARQAAEKKQ